jgi:aspartate aminotransferase
MCHFGLNETFQKDDFPNKVIVGVGLYCDGAGKPCVLPCVLKAEKILMEKGLDMEHAGIGSNIAVIAFAVEISSGSPWIQNIR